MIIEGDIENIPSDAKHRTVSRKQANMTEAKLRRLIKRGSISDDKVKAYKAKMLDNPYLELKSNSSGYLQRRYIQFGTPLNVPVKGKFDVFGLSKSATVPWF